MKLLLDTNMLLVPAQFNADVYSQLPEYEKVTLSSCVAELEKISRGKSRTAAEAKLALDILRNKNIEVIGTKDKADRAIVKYATMEKCAVATNDVALIKLLKQKRITVLRLRQRKFLQED